MTDTELNKKICEKLGICWHEGDCAKLSNPYDVRHGQYVLFCKHCKMELDSDYEQHNPDFTQNAKVLLEAMKEELSLTDWYTFHRSVGGGIKKEYIYLTYILNPRSLCEKFLEFMEGK